MLSLSTAAKNEWLVDTSFRLLFNGGYLWLYNGQRPNHPDRDVAGDLIAAITNDGLYPNRHSNEFLRNALSLDFTANDGILYGTTQNMLGEPIWKIHVVKSGTPTWFRFTQWNDLPNHESTNKVRMDGNIGEELVLLNGNLTVGSSETVDVFRVYL